MIKIKLFFVLILICFCSINAQINLNKQNQTSDDLLNVITVTIGGNFIVNGSFPASRIETVDQFVTRIYENAKSVALTSARDKKSLYAVKNEIKNFALRNIQLIHKDGSKEIIDLQLYRVTADYKNNPYLKNGDVIVFPMLDLENGFIEINGGVNKAGKYQFVLGDKLSTIVKLAQGLNPAYKIKGFEISRLNYSGEEAKIIKLGVNEDCELEIGDRIRVLADNPERKDFKVLVLGEVNMPGYLYITKNSTNVYDIIKMAGGFKSSANLKRTELLRNNNSTNILTAKYLKEEWENSSELELKNYIKKLDFLSITRMANITYEDSSYYNLDLRLLSGLNQIMLDFSEPDNETLKNTIVKNGDVLIVPEKTNNIYIFGQVNNVGYQHYERGKTIEDYIKLSGGLGEEAVDMDEIVLIKGSFNKWIYNDKDSLKIDAGDMIYIPKRPQRTLDYYIKNAGTIISAVGTLVLVFLQIFK